MAKRYSKVICPGALTPTEVLAAWEAGADAVKIFPCGNVGGAKYIKALKGPFPQIEMVPTGGVNLETIGDFLKAGSCACGVGGELVDNKSVVGGPLRRDRGARPPVPGGDRQGAVGDEGGNGVVRPRLALAALALLCAIAYAPALSLPLIEDDYPSLAQAQVLGGPQHLGRAAPQHGVPRARDQRVEHVLAVEGGGPDARRCTTRSVCCCTS